MKRIKDMGLWLWIVAFVTFIPFTVAIFLLIYDVYPPQIRGTIIQSLVAVPVIFEFRTRLTDTLHNMADWHYFGRPDTEKEGGRLYRCFRAIGHTRRPQRGKAATIERSLVSVLGFLNIIFMVFYLVVGNWIQVANT